MTNENKKANRCKPPGNSNATDAANAADVWKLKFLALYSVQYNSGLSRFYAKLHEASVIVSLMTCMSIVTELLAKSNYKVSAFVALANVLLQVVSSVKDFQGKSARYKIQNDRYYEIYKSVENGLLSASEYASLKQRYDSYEFSDIDNGMHVYGEYCYNATCIQLGVENKYLVKIPWFKRLTRCFIGWSVIPRD